MTIVGGLRARIIGDSMFHMVKTALTALGWFSPGRQHLPIVMVAEEQKWDVEIPLNTLAIFNSDVSDEELELGSPLAEDRWTYYIDFYAENEAVGKHLINDVRDILRGKLPSIGRTGPTLTVLNYTAATPTPVFKCHLQQIAVDRAHDFPRSWLQHWFTCVVEVVDAYGDENDA